jgi:copper chaperone CopZ
VITTLRITGMSCNNCVRHVGEALRGVAGVSGVDVNLPEGSATVTHDGPIELASLVKAVESAGYDAIAI